MKNNNSSIKPVVAVGIGAALFFVLGRFVAIPSPVSYTHLGPDHGRGVGSPDDAVPRPAAGHSGCDC